MDEFTQGMLKRAEQRSRTRGLISTAPKNPLGEYNHDNLSVGSGGSASPKKTPSPTKAKFSTSKASPSPSKKNSIQRQIVSGASTDSKENVDLAFEINITTGPNVQVQVEVEERDIDADGNVIEKQVEDAPAVIRDSSRNRLQRLGALYSETENLSSPIHRNEARFDEEMQAAQQVQSGAAARPPHQRFGKLAALAQSINNWEDDTTTLTTTTNSSTSTTSPTKKPTNDAKIIATSPRKTNECKLTKQKSILSPNKNKQQDKTTAQSKQLKWDQNVMDALEQQGFQRRESSTTKLTYDYGKSEKATNDSNHKSTNEPQKYTTNVHIPIGPEPKDNVDNAPKVLKKAAPPPPVSKGIVSNRAALFEKSRKSIASAKSQKDPSDLSIKERLALFERNKGEALIPKAALGMSASSKQIMGDKKDVVATPTPSKKLSPEKPQIKPYNAPVMAESNAAGNCIRNTVAALMSNVTTISESQISLDVRKQREKEMDILLNRFNRPTGSTDEESQSPDEGVPMYENSKRFVQATAPPMTPPPAPPMPPKNLLTPGGHHVEAKSKIKRKSNEKMSPDQAKKLQQSGDRIYPHLSDLETTTATGTEEDDDDYTTATVSGTTDEEQRQYKFSGGARKYYENDDDDDSYMNSEEEEEEDDICNISLGRAIMQAVEQNAPRRSSGDSRKEYYDSKNERRKREQYYGQQQQADSSNASDDPIDEMDEYLDEALDEDDESYEEKITPRKGSISSNSFSYAKSPSKSVRHQTIDEESENGPINYKSPIKSELTVNPSDDNNIVTLTHTVSFYRRQQSQSVTNTPVRKVTYSNHRPASSTVTSSSRQVNYDEDVDDQDQDDDDDEFNSKEAMNNFIKVQDRKKHLENEMLKQEQIIKQTSQALNLCAQTVEFSGSAESVEFERHLLLATKTRRAIEEECQRLKVTECTSDTDGQDRGRLIVKDINVPLSDDYIKKLNADIIDGHHFVCLLRYNENVVATKIVTTSKGLKVISFPDTLQLNNVYGNFTVFLEIYGMLAQREILPHDIKYHINKKIKTPKGKKANESSLLVRPPIQSPGGPGVVRKSALTLYGFVTFSIKEIQRTNWSLNQESCLTPLLGNVRMAVRCELSVSIDYNGFLTMFEDVSGFGAWNRRWCRLYGNVLSYWRYPGDEKTKPPMGSIDIKNCCNRKIEPARRDVCSRLNTLLMEIKRPCQEDDKDSLVIERHSKYTIVRYLLSADTKEDRDKWCAHFNKALILVRSWAPSSSQNQ